MDPIIGSLVLPNGAVHTASAHVPENNPDPIWARFKGQGGSTLGLHVYARSSNAIVFGTIRISNGAINPDGSGFPGVVFYDSLTLKAPAGFLWVTLPKAGEFVSGQDWRIAVKPPTDSHVFRAKQLMEWPFALVAVGNEAGKARAAAHMRYQALEIPDPVQDYGPAMSVQPKVDRAKYESRRAAEANQILSAQQYGLEVYVDDVAHVEHAAMGPLWMDGQGEQGAPGGFGIDPSHGWEQCKSSVLVHALVYRANIARQFCAVYNATTGRPMSLSEWTRIPERGHMHNEPGMEDVYEMDFFTDGNWRYKRFNSGNCSYGWDLARYQGHDMAHGIRLMRHMIPLIEYSPIDRRPVLDSLLCAAEHWRGMHWSNRSDERLTDPQNPDNWVSSSLTKAFDDKTREPHRAGWFDRNYAWMCYAGACVIKYLAQGPRRDEWVVWGKKMLETGLLAADKFGFTMREQRDELPQGVDGLLAFHESLNVVGMFALDQQVGPMQVGALFSKKLKSMLVDLPPQVDEYNSNVRGPRHWIGTQRHGVELAKLEDKYCSGGGDPAHVLAACAFAFRASGDPAPLTWALKHLVPHQTLQQRLAWCKAKDQDANDRSWSAEMESVLAKHLGVT